MTSTHMTCDEAEVLLHALLDNELDAGNSRDVEAHVANCTHCTALLRDYRAMKAAMGDAGLGFAAPASLRAKFDAIAPAVASPAAPVIPLAARASRRDMLAGMGLGAVASALAASGAFLLVMRSDDQQRILGDVVSAHLRSLQVAHLTDVISTDQHTVKPWFNGRLDVAPPVVDLTAEGFSLIGGRLDYIDARPVAAIVYRRRIHVINLFVWPGHDKVDRPVAVSNFHGFNVRRWSENGFELWAVSDINPDELMEFGEKIQRAMRS